MLMLERSLVNGAQRLELTGWTASRLDWYKAQGCFTEIIRFQTRLFVALEGAPGTLARIGSETGQILPNGIISLIYCHKEIASAGIATR